MPIALSFSLEMRMTLRPDLPSSPCSGCIRSTGERKWCSKSLFRTSMDMTQRFSFVSLITITSDAPANGVLRGEAFASNEALPVRATAFSSATLHTSMRHHPSLFFIVAVVSSVFAQNPKPVADRLAAQNALFDEQYESDLRNFPERPTAFGAYRYNDKLADNSLAAIAQRNESNRVFLSRLQAIPTTGFSDQDQLSHDLLIRVLQQRIADFDLKEYEMPINQQNGIHTSLADLPLSVPFDSVKHYEDYIARLHQIPRVLSQTQEVLRAGMKDNLMPVRFLIEKLPVQCQGIIDADPFLLPTKKYPADIAPEDQKRLTQQIAAAIDADVIPAYKAFASFFSTDYAPHGGTTLAVTSLPDGEKRYQNDIYGRTTTHMSPDEIHQL